MGINLFGIEDKLDELKDKNPVLGEIVKQAIDQPLHVLMAVASVWVIGWPLLNFTEAPLWVAATVAGVVTAAWMGVREYLQWPSSRWWDPPLDWFFEAAGLALGLWSLISWLG